MALLQFRRSMIISATTSQPFGRIYSILIKIWRRKISINKINCSWSSSKEEYNVNVKQLKALKSSHSRIFAFLQREISSQYENCMISNKTLMKIVRNETMLPNSIFHSTANLNIFPLRCQFIFHLESLLMIWDFPSYCFSAPLLLSIAFLLLGIMTLIITIIPLSFRSVLAVIAALPSFPSCHWKSSSSSCW